MGWSPIIHGLLFIFFVIILVCKLNQRHRTSVIDLRQLFLSFQKFLLLLQHLLLLFFLCSGLSVGFEFFFGIEPLFQAVAIIIWFIPHLNWQSMMTISERTPARVFTVL